MTAALIALAFFNLLAFCLFGLDKRLARAGRRRIRERTLLASAACFGTLGALTGMWVFRHKTKHASFVVGVPLALLAQCAMLWFIHGWIPK